MALVIQVGIVCAETALQIGHKEAETECRLLSQEAHQLWEQEKEKMRGSGELT